MNIFRCSDKPIIKERLITESNKDRERDGNSFNCNYNNNYSKEGESESFFSQMGKERMFGLNSSKHKSLASPSKTPKISRLKNSNNNLLARSDILGKSSPRGTGQFKHHSSYSSNLSNVYSFSVNVKKINNSGSLANIGGSNIGRNSPNLGSGVQIKTLGLHPTLSKGDVRLRSLVSKIQSVNNK